MPLPDNEGDTMTTNAPAPASVKRPGLAAACRALSISAKDFREAVAGLDDQDRTDLIDGTYKVTDERRDLARARCTRGQYARKGACNLMEVEFI
jgi:hypothetical protein